MLLYRIQEVWRGIEVAAAAGIVAGDAAKELKVISEVSTEAVAVIHKFLESTPITVNFSDSKKIFDIMITFMVMAILLMYASVSFIQI